MSAVATQKVQPISCKNRDLAAKLALATAGVDLLSRCGVHVQEIRLHGPRPHLIVSEDGAREPSLKSYLYSPTMSQHTDPITRDRYVIVRAAVVVDGHHVAVVAYRAGGGAL